MSRPISTSASASQRVGCTSPIEGHPSAGYGKWLGRLGKRLSGEKPIEDRLEESLGSYWRRRAEQHTQDAYMGVPISKFPEDLRVYEHLLWMDKPNVVIELGTHYGGSALWFRDRLRSLAAYGVISFPKVISVDIETERAREQLDGIDRGWELGISLIEGDVHDPDLPGRVAALFPYEARCLVVEDSAHTYETTMASLNGFSRFVHPGGFFVVEDGCVDIEAMRIEKGWPRGVLPAVEDWLADNEDFTQRRDVELYGMTCHPGGFLQRRA